MTKTINDLETCALFHGLSQEGLINLFELVQTERFQAGSRILEQGLTYRSLWAIVRGRCEVIRTGAGKNEHQLAILEPGGIFGEMSFFQEAPHSATVRALTDVEALHITPAAYEKLKTNDVKSALVIASNLVRLLSDRLRRMDNWTCELVENSSDGRQFAEWREFQSKLYTDWSF